MYLFGNLLIYEYLLDICHILATVLGTADKMGNNTDSRGVMELSARGGIHREAGSHDKAWKMVFGK